MLDISQFEKIDEFGDIEKFIQQVNTPVEGGVEENKITVYRIASTLVKVSKVGTLGWMINVYDANNPEVYKSREDGYLDQEVDAHERAKDIVVGVAEQLE